MSRFPFFCLLGLLVLLAMALVGMALEPVVPLFLRVLIVAAALIVVSFVAWMTRELVLEGRR